MVLGFFWQHPALGDPGVTGDHEYPMRRELQEKAAAQALTQQDCSSSSFGLPSSDKKEMLSDCRLGCYHYVQL